MDKEILKDILQIQKELSMMQYKHMVAILNIVESMLNYIHANESNNSNQRMHVDR